MNQQDSRTENSQAYDAEIIDAKVIDPPQEQTEEQAGEQTEGQDLKEQDEKEQKPKLRFPNLMDLLALIGVFFIASIAGQFVAGFMGANTTDSIGLFTFISYVFSFGATLLFALPYSYFRSGRSFSPIRLSFDGFNVSTLLWGFVLILSLGVVLEPLTASFDKSFVEQLSNLMGSGDWFMLSALVAAPILEELLFRGVVQGSLTNRYGPFVGIIVSALTFGLIHGNPVQVCNAFFVGLVLGYVYHRTGTLWSVILLHFFNNAFSYFVWMLGGQTIITLSDIITNEHIYKIVYIAAAAITLVSFVLLFRALKQKPEPTLDNKAV